VRILRRRRLPPAVVAVAAADVSPPRHSRSTVRPPPPQPSVAFARVCRLSRAPPPVRRAIAVTQGSRPPPPGRDFRSPFYYPSRVSTTAAAVRHGARRAQSGRPTSAAVDALSV